MNPLYKAAIAVLLSVGIFGGGYAFGRHVKTGEVAQEKLDIAVAYAGEVEKQQDRADKLSADLAATREAQAPKDRIITKEITRYVQVTPPEQRCTLPGTWRLRHDAAATGMPIDAGTEPVAADSAAPVEDAAALETVGDNYAACRDAIDKVIGWQRYWREVPRQ